MSATGIALLDSDGSVIEELSLQAEDPATFAAAVGAAVGTPAVEELVEGGPEGAAMTASYSWVGLKITSYFSPGECGGTDCRGTFVSLTSPNSGGLTLRTVSGISVGDTVESTMSLGARSTREIPLAAEPEDPELFDSETESTRIVILDVSVDESVIDTIRAGGMHTHGNI